MLELPPELGPKISQIKQQIDFSNSKLIGLFHSIGDFSFESREESRFIFQRFMGFSREKIGDILIFPEIAPEGAKGYHVRNRERGCQTTRGRTIDGLCKAAEDFLYPVFLDALHEIQAFSAP